MNIIQWLKLKRDQRRERLLRKWGKTYYFISRSISDKLEFEYLSVTPNDGQWHHVAISVLAWAKKNELENKIAEVSVLLDGNEVMRQNTPHIKAES